MKNKTKEKENKSINYVIAIISILAVTAIIYSVWIIFAEKLDETSYAAAEIMQNNSNINKNDYQISEKRLNELEPNLEEIIKNNTKEIKKEKIIVEKKDLEYTTRYTNNPDLPKGMIQVIQEGVDGKQEIYKKKIYVGENLIKEESIGSKVIKSSINKLVAIGTGAYSNNYKVKVGDTLYTTSSPLAVRIEANEKAKKIISLNKNVEVKLLQKSEKWYKIQYQSYIGWAKAECFTYLQPGTKQEETNTNKNQYTKQQLINKLNFNMKLNKPSGLSVEQFKKIFENESKDKNKIFVNNAQYFYYAEKQYGINGVFLAAVAIHESGWGTSKIANDKNNLFGYGAYDRSPYESSYQFSDYSEGIDLLARVFTKYYLNPAGTKIYDGNKAAGTYYHGPTLSGVNTKYATDKNWANAVYTWMKYLYNNL